MAALDALHDDHRGAARVDRHVVHGDDVGVLERAGDRRFAQDPQRGVDVGRAVAERLHGDVAAHRGLRGEVDDAHPALAQGALEVDLSVELSGHFPQRGVGRDPAQGDVARGLEGRSRAELDRRREIQVFREARLD